MPVVDTPITSQGALRRICANSRWIFRGRIHVIPSLFDEQIDRPLLEIHPAERCRRYRTRMLRCRYLNEIAGNAMKIRFRRSFAPAVIAAGIAPQIGARPANGLRYLAGDDYNEWQRRK